MNEEIHKVLLNDPIYQQQLQSRASNGVFSGKSMMTLVVGFLASLLMLRLLLAIPGIGRILTLVVPLALLLLVAWWISRSMGSGQRYKQILEQDAERIVFSLRTGRFSLDPARGKEGMLLTLADDHTLKCSLVSIAKFEELRKEEHDVEELINGGNRAFTKPLLGDD